MNEYEIFLSRLADKEELYAEISRKTGKCSCTDDIAEFLSNISDDSAIRLYISNEDIVNDELEKITEAFKAGAESHGISINIIVDEFVNIIDSSNRITSEYKPRTVVHRDGDLHPTVHIWIIRRRDMGIYALLQKRADCKKINPGCWDVSAAGHVTQGGEFRESAVREISEELGLEIRPENLEFIGTRKSEVCTGEYTDRELNAVYLFKEKIDISSLKLQESEVSETSWVEIDELLSVMKNSSIKNCIDTEELFMIKKAVF